MADPIPRDEFGRLRDGPSVEEIRAGFSCHRKPGSDRTGQRLGVWTMLAGGYRGKFAWLARGACGHEQVVNTREASRQRCRTCAIEARATRHKTSDGRRPPSPRPPRAAAEPAGRDRGPLRGRDEAKP